MTIGERKCHRKSGALPSASFTTWRSFMNFSIAKITRHLLAPQHEFSCSWLLWMRLLRNLRSRGNGTRESGAFLLGHREDANRCRVVDYLLYDDIDPHALDSGI